MLYMLDTNICIALMRKNPLVIKRLSAVFPTDCVVSSITTYELYTGIEKCLAPTTEGAKVGFLLATIAELFFDNNAAREAGRIRAQLESQGCMIGPYDILLAGHAFSAGLTLITSNTKEFNRISDLKLEDWQVSC